MADITIVGGGEVARGCDQVLARAGFDVLRTMDVAEGGRTPVVLGDVGAAAFQMAHRAVETGRHTLLAVPQAITPERLALLLQLRKRSQALFLWSERRHHPAYRFAAGLMETDNTWRPRYLRQETLATEPTNSTLFRWRTLEALGLLSSIANDAPQKVSATAVMNSKRNAPDLVNLCVGYAGLQAILQVGQGEPIERRETVLAATERKAFLDELNPVTPIRIIEDQPLPQSSRARWLSWPSPTGDDLARQQCIAFLDATLETRKALDEAALWLRSLAILAAMDQSLRTNGAVVEVAIRSEEPRFRLIERQPERDSPEVA